MKKAIITVLFLLLGVTTAWAGDSYYIKNTSEGITSEKMAMVFSEGDISAATADKMGYGMAVYKFAPNSSMKLHSVKEDWIGYVTRGSGKLILANADKEVISTIVFKAGDFFVFEPDTFHAWEIGEEGMDSVWVRKK